MTLISNSIITGVVTCVEAMTVTMDKDAPTRFKQATVDTVDDHAGDRVFWVELLGGGSRNFTGIAGRVDRTMRFRLRVRYINKFRSSSVFAAIIAQDMERLQDRVPVYLRANVSGCNEVVEDGEATFIRDSAEANLYTLLVPFRAEFNDDQVTT